MAVTANPHFPIWPTQQQINDCHSWKGLDQKDITSNYSGNKFLPILTKFHTVKPRRRTKSELKTKSRILHSS
jgi:hypothetical protein